MNIKRWSSSIKLSNEDAASTGNNWLVVLDGATPLDDLSSANLSTSTFVSKIVEYIDQNGISAENIQEDLQDAITFAQAKCGKKGVTSTISAAAWNGKYLRTASLGDSFILVETSKQILKISDPNFRGREELILDNVKRRILTEDNPSQVYRETVDYLKNERKHRNSPAGVWVISDGDDPATICSRMSVSHWKLAQIHGVIAGTDGAWNGINPFNFTTSNDLFRLARADRIAEYFRDIEVYEKSDVTRRRYPRLSYMDDRTITFADFS